MRLKQRETLGRELRKGAPGLTVRSGTSETSGLVEVTGTVIVYDTPYEVFDLFGSFRETIHAGACTELLASPTLDCRFLFNHGDWPLARTGSAATLTLTDTPKGLDVKALVDPRMSSANDLIVALECGLITQMSVGMLIDPDRDVWSGEDEHGYPNVRNIYRLRDIPDVSAVTFPASPTTSIELAQRSTSPRSKLKRGTRRRTSARRMTAAEIDRDVDSLRAVGVEHIRRSHGL